MYCVDYTPRAYAECYNYCTCTTCIVQALKAFCRSYKYGTGPTSVVHALQLLLLPCTRIIAPYLYFYLISIESLQHVLRRLHGSHAWQVLQLLYMHYTYCTYRTRILHALQVLYRPYKYCYYRIQVLLPRTSIITWSASRACSMYCVDWTARAYGEW